MPDIYSVNPVQETSTALSTSLSGGGRGVRDIYADAALGMHTAARQSSALLVVGMVTWSGGKTYDCKVLIEGEEVGCAVMQSCLSLCPGYSFGSVPPPGARVVVMLAGFGAPRGVIVGVLPMGRFLPENGAVMFGKSMMGFGEDYDEVPSDSFAAFRTIPRGRKDAARLMSPSERPMDMVPGDVSLVNENNCGFYGSEFTATLMGGGAYVRLFRIDDEIRMRSTNLTVWTDSFAEEHYNDCGYCSGERREYSFYGERIGRDRLKGEIDVEGRHPRARVVDYTGFLGGVRSTFVYRPAEGDVDLERVPRGGKGKWKGDEGVYSSRIGQSGECLVRSVGGIAMERYDRIPVPARIRRPWDREDGDDASKVKVRKFKPFEHDENEHFRPLELYDEVAWNAGRQYSRFDDFGKDFHVEEEKDLKTPGDDEKDPFESSTKLEGSGGRRAGIYIGDNGSIVIRDAWGSEIVMNGGDIHISCRGTVHTTVGRSSVTMARHSIVSKALRGVAEMSSENVVNISGRDHVSIMGGRDGKDARGGVVIEALGTGETRNGGRLAKGRGGQDERYEDGVVSGIVLKSAGDVAVGSENIDFTARDGMLFTTGESGKTRTGSIEFDTGGFSSTSVESRFVSKSSVISASASGVEIVSKSRVVVGGGVVEVYNGRQYVSLLGIPLDEDPNKDTLDRAKAEYETAQDRTDDTVYSYGYFLNHVYALPGSSWDYDCEKGVEGWDMSDEFVIVLPAWMSYDLAEELRGRAVEDTGDRRDDEPFRDDDRNKFNGRFLWPGNLAVKKGKVVSLDDGRSNLRDGYSVERKELLNKVEVRKDPLSEFRLRQKENSK